MTRSVWKLPFVDGFLLKKVEEALQKGIASPIRTMSRRSTILPNFVGLNIEVYNGKKYILVQITEDKIGHKLGEFSPTRTFHGHSKKSEGGKKDGGKK